MRIMLIIIFLLVFCSTAAAQSGIFYKCNFEEQCEDFVFDSYWIVKNVSSHIDHTYGNLSGHYITYTNTSVSEPLTTYSTRNWIDTQTNLVACLSQWIYSGPGGVYYTVELAQGDDHQARLPVGGVGMNTDDPQWRGLLSLELPYATHFVPYIIFTNITSSLDLDDLSVWSCSSQKPIPRIITVFDCDFDKTLSLELVSFSDYSYSWSIIQAGEAQLYAATAPAVDYSIGDRTGHYIWLNNSDSLKSGGAGYLSTNVFHVKPEPTYCLSFQYYRFGLYFQTSRLTVLALKEGNEKSVEQVWPINPINYTYINNRWSWAYAPIPIGNYSLLFRMDSDYEVNSSFAIDSISISSCGYPQHYFYGTSYLEFACDFDSSCDIRDDYTDFNPQSVINYTLQSPYSIADRELGPRQTTGWSGDYFLYWSRSEQTSATLINGQFKTPLIETNRDMCIRFAYFVNSTGVQLNENNTKIHILARGCHIETIWSIELDNSFGWQLVTQSLYPTACTQGFYFQITQQRPTRVAVAFDDITIAQCGSLDVLTTTVPPSTTPLVSPSTTTSISPSTTPSVSPSTTTSVSPSTTLSVSPSTTTSVSPSTTLSVSPSTTPSVSPSTTLSVSPSTTTSVSPSTTLSVSPSTTTSVSPSTTLSVSPSTTPSVSPSTTTSVSPSTTLSVSPSTTPSVSPNSTSFNKSSSNHINSILLITVLLFFLNIHFRYNN